MGVVKKLKRINPVFYKALPKDWKEWFTPGYKSDYRLKHPIAHKVFGVIIMILLFLPSAFFVYSFVIFTRAGVEIFGPLAGLGIIGSMLIGLGLCNIVFAFIHQYLGHRVTCISIAAGIFVLLITYFFVFY